MTAATQPVCCLPATERSSEDCGTLGVAAIRVASSAISEMASFPKRRLSFFAAYYAHRAQ
jgi:hypothetical protein